VNNRLTVVALFDVLGFGERVRSYGLRNLTLAYNQLTQVVRRRRNCLIIDATIPLGESEEGYPITGTALAELVVNKTYFSDTILFWAIYDRARFWTFCSICAEFFCEVLNMRIPLRGGISLGEAYMNNRTRTYLGYPLVEADRVEKTQLWLGVSFGPSFAEYPFKHYFRAEHVLYYTAHRKPGNTQYIPGFVLDWPRQWRKMYTHSLYEHLAGMNINPKYQDYYLRAIQFAELSERAERESECT